MFDSDCHSIATLLTSKAPLKFHLDMCFTLGVHILVLSSACLFIFKVRLCSRYLVAQSGTRKEDHTMYSI